MMLEISRNRWINFGQRVDYSKLFDEVAAERIWPHIRIPVRRKRA